MKPPIVIDEKVVAQLQALEAQVLLVSDHLDFTDMQTGSTLSFVERFARRASLRSQITQITDALPSEESRRTHRRIARARAEEQGWRDWAAKGGPRHSDAWPDAANGNQGEVTR